MFQELSRRLSLSGSSSNPGRPSDPTGPSLWATVNHPFVFISVHSQTLHPNTQRSVRCVMRCFCGNLSFPHALWSSGKWVLLIDYVSAPLSPVLLRLAQLHSVSTLVRLKRPALMSLSPQQDYLRRVETHRFRSRSRHG